MSGERCKIGFDSSIHAFYRAPFSLPFLMISLVCILFTVPVSVNTSPHVYIGPWTEKKTQRGSTEGETKQCQSWQAWHMIHGAGVDKDARIGFLAIVRWRSGVSPCLAKSRLVSIAQATWRWTASPAMSQLHAEWEARVAAR